MYDIGITLERNELRGSMGSASQNRKEEAVYQNMVYFTFQHMLKKATDL